MAKNKYTQLTTKFLKEHGYTYEIVERWNHFAKCRVDLFGVIDIVAIADGITVGVQSTSANGHAARRKKILASDLAFRWLRAGNALWLMSWRQRKKGTRWIMRLEDFQVEDFEHDYGNAEKEEGTNTKEQTTGEKPE